MAVSETFAKRYFGDTNPLGEIVTAESGEARKITLVFEDLPENTHLKYDVLFSYNQPRLAVPDDAAQRNDALFSTNGYTYLLMPEDYDANTFAGVSEAFFERHMAEMARVSKNRAWSAWLEPLAAIHYGSNTRSDLPTGNPFYLYGFASVAIFLLLVACINYMNLATARSAKRAREVGMRKVLGASRWSLTAQFLGESLALALIALCVAVALVVLGLNVLPVDDLLGAPLSLSAANQPTLIAALLVLGASVGIASGLYPAFYLSAAAPLSALAASGRGGMRGARLRECLVLLQFTISVGVIACTLLMVSQMRFISDRTLGFIEENRLLVTLRGQDAIDQIPVLQNELAANPRVLGVSASTSMMGRNFAANTVSVETNTGAVQRMQVSHMGVAENFVDVMGMSLASGRNFSLAADGPNGLLVNEALVTYMNWEQPLGKTVQIGGSNGPQGTVVGIVRDFNFRSLHTSVEPFVLYPFEFLGVVSPAARPFQQRLVIVQVAGERVGDTLDFIRGTVARLAPEQPFEYRFLDESLDALYLSEQRLIRLIGMFGGICIFVACLGLLGLAAFTTEQRTGEIGIRKVLGASAVQIVTLLTGKVIVLVLAGAGIATVLSYFAMDAWLENFAYRTAISPGVFIAATAVALAVAYATVGWQSLRAARGIPAQALRSD